MKKLVAAMKKLAAVCLGAVSAILVVVLIQTVCSALCLWLVGDWILPLADITWCGGFTLWEYLVFGLATIPLRMIFVSASSSS